MRLVIGLLLISCVVSCGESEKEKQERLAREEKQRLEAIQAPLIDKAKRDLLDPESAQFRDLKLIEKGPKGVPVLCGQINAKNGAGGYVGFIYFVSSADKAYICKDSDWIEMRMCRERLLENGCLAK